MTEEISSKTPYYPNKMGRIFLKTLNEALLLDSYSKLLQATGLMALSENRPPDNWEKKFDFNVISRLMYGVEKLYGPRGGRRLAESAGRKFFQSGWGAQGKLSTTAPIILKSQSLAEKVESGIKSIAKQISEISDQKTWVSKEGRQMNYCVAVCPICWNRVADQPVCHHTVGFLQAASRWYGDGSDFRIRQTSCTAVGEEHCIFRIDLEPLKS